MTAQIIPGTSSISSCSAARATWPCASCCRASATATTTGSLPRIAASLVCRAARSTGTAMCERSKAACAATSPPTTSTKPRSRSSLGGSDHVTLDATALEGWPGLAAKVAGARLEEAA